MARSLIPYGSRASPPSLPPMRILAVERHPPTVDQRLDHLTRSVENLQKTMDRFATIYQSDRAQQRPDAPEDKILQLETQMSRQARIHAEERLLWQKERKKLKKQLADCQARLRKSPTKDSSTQMTPFEFMYNPGRPNYLQPFKCLKCYQTYGRKDDLERHQANECHKRPPTKYDELCEKTRAVQSIFPAPKHETNVQHREPILPKPYDFFNLCEKNRAIQFTLPACLKHLKVEINPRHGRPEITTPEPFRFGTRCRTNLPIKKERFYENVTYPFFPIDAGQPQPMLKKVKFERFTENSFSEEKPAVLSEDKFELLSESLRTGCSLEEEIDLTETPIVLEAEDDATEWEFIESEAKKTA